MKRFLFSTLSFLAAALGVCANPLWEGAEYLALGYMSSDTSQKALMYFDGSGNQLGYVRLETSNYAGATSIAFGSGIVPNLSGGDGLMLLRSANNFASTSNFVTINLYDNPLTTSIDNGAQLARQSGCTYAVLGVASNSSTDYIDVAKQIDRAQNGLVTLLVDRYNKETNELMASYVYKYSMPDTLSAGSMVNRVQTETQENRWDIGNVEVVNFASGIFTTEATADMPNQFALLDVGGNIRIYVGSDLDVNVSLVNGFSIVQEGKEIVSIWGDDNYTLTVLYDDNSVLEYDSRTGELNGNSYSMNTDYTILDVVKVGSIVVPEPAQYALAFGVFAILFAVWRKRR